MSSRIIPSGIRLLGFSQAEEEAFAAQFAAAGARASRYVVLEEDNLQDPDLYLADAVSLAALASLPDLRPNSLRPALLVGRPEVALELPWLERPLDWERLFAAMDELVAERTKTLARLGTAGALRVAERRRSKRLDLDLTDPAHYEKMRRNPPEDGMVLVVDKKPALKDYLSRLLERYQVKVALAGDEASAGELRMWQPVALTLVNTSTPGVDPYRLCRTLHDMDPASGMAAVLLTGRSHSYDGERARQAGIEGYLNKPLAGFALLTVLKRYLPRLW